MNLTEGASTKIMDKLKQNNLKTDMIAIRSPRRISL